MVKFFLPHIFHSIFVFAYITIFIKSDQTPKLIRIKTPTPPNFQLIPFWADNVEAWFCYAEAEFPNQCVTDPRV